MEMNKAKQTLYYETITEGDTNCVLASNFHKATQKEIAEAKRLHKTGKCSHTIFYDIDGWIYDMRICGTCGIGRGLI